MRSRQRIEIAYKPFETGGGGGGDMKQGGGVWYDPGAGIQPQKTLPLSKDLNF